MDYKKLLNSLPILIFVNAPNAIQVEFYNDTWHEYTGLTVEDVKSGWSHIVHPDDLQRVVAVIMEAVKDKSPYQVELRLKNGKTNRYRWFLSTCTPIIDEKDEIEAWVGVSTDITIMKEGFERTQASLEDEIESRLRRIKELEEELEIHKTMENK